MLLNGLSKSDNENVLRLKWPYDQIKIGKSNCKIVNINGKIERLCFG